jgi:hypothetical protein
MLYIVTSVCIQFKIRFRHPLILFTRHNFCILSLYSNTSPERGRFKLSPLFSYSTYCILLLIKLNMSTEQLSAHLSTGLITDGHIVWAQILKGRQIWDFQLLVFFTYQFPSLPWIPYWSHLTFLRKFANKFKCKG